MPYLKLFTLYHLVNYADHCHCLKLFLSWGGKWYDCYVLLQCYLDTWPGLVCGLKYSVWMASCVLWFTKQCLVLNSSIGCWVTTNMLKSHKDQVPRKINTKWKRKYEGKQTKKERKKAGFPSAFQDTIKIFFSLFRLWWFNLDNDKKVNYAF